MKDCVKSLAKIIIQQNNEIEMLNNEIKSLKKEVESVRKIASILCIDDIVKNQRSTKVNGPKLTY